MRTKSLIKDVLSVNPTVETAVRKRYFLPELYRTLLVARLGRRGPYPAAKPAGGRPHSPATERLVTAIGLYIERQMNGQLYNPPLHPALKTFPSQRESGDRYRLIAENVHASEGRVLDIGCHIGAYFASRFDDEGFDAIALDENAAHAYFSKRLCALRNPDVQVVWDSLFTWNGRHGPFDVVLGFNVFHHMLKEKRLFERLKRWFREVRTTELFVQLPDQETPLWEGVYDWLTAEEWVELILAESTLDRADCLGRPSNDRPLYHLVNTRRLE